MMRIINTERLPPQPLDKAAACILTDRGVPFARASWQQCICCDEWIEDENIEYSFTCDLATSTKGLPTVNFELKTRYPAYTCPACSSAPKRAPSSAAGSGSAAANDGEEAEQLCPLHVQAVYVLHGSREADNMRAIIKGFGVCCPDCHAKSGLLKTPQQVKQFVQQHVADSSSCPTLSKALRTGTYNSPAAFGGRNMTSTVKAEKVIKELLSRLVIVTACHIVSNTRPPPTPVDQLAGQARKTAAATAHLRSSSQPRSRSDIQQLMPYRAWAVDALSRDSDLLAEANWVRPSLEGLSLDHKPSLLDVVLAPPYIAVAEHDAGMTVDKLGVLLLWDQQRRKQNSLLRLAAAAAVGEQVPAAVAAVEAAIAELLASDAVFQHVPQQQRVQQFMDWVGIASLGDVLYALAQPHVQGHGAQNRHLTICAVCGMSAAALKHAKRPWALHRCKYCIICTCQACKQEQQQQQPAPDNAAEAAAAGQLCLWCQGHPDTEDVEFVPAHSSRGADSSINRSQQQQQQYYTSSPEASAEVEEAAAVLWGVRRSSDSSLGSQQQREGPSCNASGDRAAERPAKDYDLVVRLAAAAAVPGQAGQDTGVKPDPRTSKSPVPTSQGEDKVLAENRLLQELDELQRLQNELQVAAERLGVQGLQLPHLQQQQQQRNVNNSKRVLSADAAAAEATDSKRQRFQQQQQQQKPPSAFTTTARIGYVGQPHVVLGPKYMLLDGKPALPSPLYAAPWQAHKTKSMPKAARAANVPRCGDCKTCNNPSLRRGCVVNRKRSAAGLPPVLPPKASAVTGTVAKKRAATAATGGRGSDKRLADLLLSSAGFKPVGSGSAAAATGDGGRHQSRPTDIVVTALQAPAALELLVDAGFRDPADARTPPPAAMCQPEELLLIKPEQQQQEQIPLISPAEAHAADSLVSALESDIQQLTADISSWKSSNSAAEHADISKTLQHMRQLKQQMADNYQQTGQQLYLHGLKILAEVVSAFCALPDAGSKVMLACNSQQPVSGACCPDDQACSVVELLMCCWFKEMQEADDVAHEGSAAAKPAAAAAELKQGKQTEVTAGYCHLVLRLLAQLSSLQQHLLHRTSSADQGSPGAAEQRLAVTLREAVVQVISGTAVLLLHWPEAGSPGDDSNSSKWRGLAVRWRQCLLQCKWSVADRSRVGGDTGAVERALGDVAELYAELMKLVGE